MRGLPVVLSDLGAEQEKAEEATGDSLLVADGLHASAAGERLSWGMLQGVLKGSGGFSKRDERPTCAGPNGAVVANGAVLEASRRCEWDAPSAVTGTTASCEGAETLARIQQSEKLRREL